MAEEFVQIRHLLREAMRFARAFKKLPLALQTHAKERITMFQADCFDERLKTHKLKGQLAPYWAFSINHSYRILFEFFGNGEAGFIDIGTHSIYN